MKRTIFFLILVSSQLCLGQTDTNVIAVGEWSEPVTDSHDYTLRGRLLIYNSEGLNRWGGWAGARVYAELQHIEHGGRDRPIEIYVDPGIINEKECLHCEMRDARDNLIHHDSWAVSMGQTAPFTVTLPSDSTRRLRLDAGWAPTEKQNGLGIYLGHAGWIIRPNATNEYFLSCTFNSPTNAPSSADVHVWKGTLKFPKVKIPAQKQ